MNKHVPNISMEKNETQRSEDENIALKDEYFSSLKQVISPEKKRPEEQQNSIFLGYKTVTLVFEAKFIVQSFLEQIWLKQILKALNKQMEFIGIYKIVNEEEKMGEKSQRKYRYIQSYYTLVIGDEQTEEESLKIDQANIEFEILREIFTKLKDQKTYREGDRAQIITEQLKALIEKYI